MSATPKNELLSLQDLGVSQKEKNMYVVDMKGQKACSDQSCRTLPEAEQRSKCSKAALVICSKNESSGVTEQTACLCRRHRYIYIALLVAGFCLSVAFTLVTQHGLRHEVFELKLQLLQLQEQCESRPVSAAGVGQSSEGSEHADDNTFPTGGQFREVPALPGLRQVEPEDHGDVFDDTHDNDVDDSDRAILGVLHRFRRQAEPGGPKKGSGKGKGKNGNKVGNGKDKQCKNLEKCAPKIEAVHYKTNFWVDRRKSEFGKEPCVFIPEWQGTACRNRTVRLSTHNEPLKFFEKAEWMSEVYKDKKPPVESINGGGFNVTKTGLYLIYSSVLFHDVKPRQSQAVVVNGVKLFKCMESVDYIDRDLPPDHNQAKYKSCAMTGVTQLKKGDRLEVQNLYANTEIDLSDDATYFGAILLTPTGN